ncbi:MAG: hypothetical protein PWP64_1149, partial [Candidatus Cloacimonadota bacterium]|nr:hypothetical protein [Candidatus Cloacimonadota bacterium]
ITCLHRIRWLKPTAYHLICLFDNLEYSLYLPVAAHRNSSYSITCLYRILRVVISGLGVLSEIPFLLNSQGIGKRSGLWEQSQVNNSMKQKGSLSNRAGLLQVDLYKKGRGSSPLLVKPPIRPGAKQGYGRGSDDISTGEGQQLST